MAIRFSRFGSSLLGRERLPLTRWSVRPFQLRLCWLFLLVLTTTCITDASAVEEDEDRLVPYFSGSGVFMSGGGEEFVASGSGEPLINTIESGSGAEPGIYYNFVVTYSIGSFELQ